MTDDLLDEATRLADSEWPPAALTIPVLRALVERVRAAEDRLDSATDAYDGWRNKALDLRSDLDEVRAKLDAVRVWLDDVYDDGTEWRDLRRLRAILDGKDNQ
jgi:predicted  nucleic acid-binding Zn-ribbon protein